MAKQKVSTSLQSLLSSREIEITVRLAAGATKTVYKGRMKLPGGVWEDVAVKVINRSFLLSEEARKAFLAEAKVLMEVDHPNVERLFEAFMTDNFVVLVTEYIKGISLDDYLERFHRERPGEFIPWQIALLIAKKIAEGLSAIQNAGFIHRDLSPNNVMISIEDSFDRGIKIIDLGLAKSTQHGKPSLSSIFEIKGTPPFSAPELTFDASRTEERADSFSLASLLYYTLTYNYPFGSLEDYYGKVKRQAMIPLQSFRKDIPQKVLEFLTAFFSDNLSFSPQDRNLPGEIAYALGEILSEHLTNIFPVYKESVLSYVFIPEINANLPDEEDPLATPAGQIKEEVSPNLKKRTGKFKIISFPGRKTGFFKKLALLAGLILAGVLLFVALPGEKKQDRPPTSFKPMLAKPSFPAKTPPASPAKAQPSSPLQKTKPAKEPLFGPAVEKIVLRSGAVETVLSPEGKVITSKVLLSGKKYIFYVKSQR